MIKLTRRSALLKLNYKPIRNYNIHEIIKTGKLFEIPIEHIRST